MRYPHADLLSVNLLSVNLLSVNLDLKGSDKRSSQLQVLWVSNLSAAFLSLPG